MFEIRDWLIQRCFIYLDPDYAGKDTRALPLARALRRRHRSADSPAAMPLLALHSVSKSYGALKVTDDISLAVDEGETLGILGPNGAGKTTLFNLISGDVRCDAGRVEYEGRDITRARSRTSAAAPASAAATRCRSPSAT